MDNQPANSNSHSQKLAAEIKKTFPKLSDADIALQASSPDKFYEAVKAKEGINKDEAEETVQKLHAECTAACNKTNDKSANANSSPLPKAANS